MQQYDKLYIHATRNSYGQSQFYPGSGIKVWDILDEYFKIKGISSVINWADIVGKPNFAPVAITGSYNDLLNKPVYNLNDLEDVTINMPVMNTVLIYNGNWTNVPISNIAQNLASHDLIQTDTLRTYRIQTNKELKFSVENLNSTFTVKTSPETQGSFDVSAGISVNKSDGVNIWNRGSINQTNMFFFEDFIETHVVGDYLLNVSNYGLGTILFTTDVLKIEINNSSNPNSGLLYNDYRTGAIVPIAGKHVLGFLDTQKLGPVDITTLIGQADWNETNTSSPSYIKNKPVVSITDTNIANTNLTLTANRNHNGNNKDLYITNVKQLALSSNDYTTLTSGNTELGLTPDSFYTYVDQGELNLTSDFGGANTSELNIGGTSGLLLRIKGNSGKTPGQVLTLKTGNKADWESIDYNNLINKPVIANSVNYSTNEQLSGRKWIDNKDIYQKTFHSPVFTATSNTINNVDTLINIEGYAHNGTNKYNWGNTLINSLANLVSNTLTISANTGYTVTVYYTKI